MPSLRLLPTSAVLIAPAGSRRLLEPALPRGLTLHEVVPGDLVKLAGTRIRVLAADHDGRRHAWSRHRGPAVGYLVEGERRWWYPGDTGPNIAFEELVDIDIALIPVGGWGPTVIPGHDQGHLDAEQAAQAISRLEPAHAVPIHCGTLWPIGLPQRTDLIDQPAPSFADHVARLSPTINVYLPKHSQPISLL